MQEGVMKRQIAIGACVVMIVASAIGAQTRPDFSGVWKPVDNAGANAPAPPPPPPGGGPPPPPPPPRTIALTIVQSATELRIERRADAGGRELIYNFTYKLDGTESGNQMGSVLLKTKAAWEGDALVLSSVASVEGNPLGQLKEVYRLEHGDLVVESTRHTPAGVMTARTVHRKQ
jgi:hypothetical protein